MYQYVAPYGESFLRTSNYTLLASKSADTVTTKLYSDTDIAVLVNHCRFIGYENATYRYIYSLAYSSSFWAHPMSINRYGSIQSP